MSVYAALVPTFIAVGGLLANCLLITAVLRGRSLREDIASTVIVSLSLSDAACSLLLVGLSAAILWIQPTILHPAVIYCHVVLTGFFSSSAFWHLALISVFKCVVVSRPLDYHRLLGAPLRHGLVGLIWACNTLTGVVNVLVGSPQFAYPLGMSNMGNWSYFLGLLGFGFFLPSGVLLLSNLRVFLFVRQAKRLEDAARDQAAWRLTIKSVRSAKNIFIMCLVFWACYAPSLIMFTIKDPPPFGLVFFAMWLYLCYPLHNPVIYIALHKKVRVEIRKLIPKRFTVEPEAADQSGSSVGTTRREKTG